jgi:nucleoside-diphosphate-sugar epimerase
VHLGAISHVQHGDAAAIYAVNVVGTANLLQALVEAGAPVQKVLLASSANVYGRAAAGTVDESTVPAPVNHYGCSKLSMEHMSRTFADKLPLVIARPFNYTGVGHPASFVVPKIVDHVKRRAAVVELGNVDVVREFNDVRGVVEIYRRLLETPASGFTVNVCSGRGCSLRQIVEMLMRLSGHRIEIRINPSLVRANEIATLLGSVDELKRRIGSVKFPSLKGMLSWMLKSD